MKRETTKHTWQWTKLPLSFYMQSDVVAVARQMIGRILVSNFNGELTAGRIVETEAYNGPFDKASHAYGNRRTDRTEVMYANGGIAYVYLCYGLHHMFNVVTNKQDVPNAILVRALEPLVGIDIMLRRTGKPALDFTLTRGPGNVGKAMGFHTVHSGQSLVGQTIYLANDELDNYKREIIASPRIGVAYAAEDALLPYRFFIKGNKYVSGKKVVQVS